VLTRFYDVPEHLPIDDLPLEIPLDWSAEQALAALEWLEQLRARVWLLYADDIQQMLRDRTSGQQLGGNDDPPF
jgi:hypothetical protein